MKRLRYLLLIAPTLIAPCTHRLDTANSQNSNSANVQNNIKTLVFDGRAGGCGHFLVYKDTPDKTKVITVSRTAEELKITAAPKIFDIGKTPGLKVQLDDYKETPHWEYCSDSISGNAPQAEQIKATSGKVTIFISARRVKGYPSGAFRITVELKNVFFPVSNGNSFYIEKAEMKDVVVGVS